ncbi:MAG: TrkH family potassium uptake protein [Clostridia bacterium]|nr:TrkH family potassium uptake protein [Clostridia bacterium]
MNFQIIFYIIGYVLKIEGLLMFIPALVGLVYREKEGLSFLFLAAVILLIGWLITRIKPKNQIFYAREGFVSVALSWIVLSLFGSLPFILNGDIPRFADAFFETVSGFTTTGSTILADVEALSHASLFWRSFTHWIGGMGVLVFILSILPITGGATMHLMRAESPGPQVGKIVPKIKDTSKILYIIYTVMTVAEILILICCRMPVFDAVTLSLGSAGTGGFAIRNSGLADYSAVCQYIIAIFVILFGVNFNVYFLLIRRHLRQAARCEEARWYGIIIALSTLLIFANTLKMFSTAEEAFRHAFFQVGSIITTTGYGTTDFNLYPEFSKVILVILMFIGACAGSTGGGIKVSRIVILVKSVFNELAQIIHPRTVKKARLEGKVIDHSTMRSVNTYMAAYVLLFFASFLLISLDNMDLTTNFTAVAATLNNIGPGLNVVGPLGNFSGFSDLSKYIFCFNMLAGRLELFPMLILFNPQTWKQPFRRRKELQNAEKTTE